VRVRVLDGARTIGGTKIYLESGASAVLLDFGLNYHQWGLYCEEYLHPRAGRGLHDFFKLGLAPLYGGLYRDDLIPAIIDQTIESILSRRRASSLMPISITVGW